ncbi:DUF262 domain-containing protein [Mucilaginibacter sp.]
METTSHTITTPHTEDDVLQLKSINKLLTSAFYIPGYQRGYRWTYIQIEQLLNDIWEFRQNPPKTAPDADKPFYCLQPIVVKEKDIDGKMYWEVIDGQQRLTTILIILYYFNQVEFREAKNIFSLAYQTRSDSEVFLNDIQNQQLAAKNIDYNHIFLAYQTISDWFTEAKKEHEPIRGDFYSTLISNVKIIWYEVEQSGGKEDDSESIDVFTRLNIGKIPLTNAELIKALFLQKSNFDDDRVDLKQLQIATEWDTIEKQLQDDSFWYFIYDPNNPLKYETRIEYIFDLMKDKEKSNELYFTFNQFYQDFKKSKKTPLDKPDIDQLWLAVKQFFLCFDEWFRDQEYYHLIGFLVDCGVPINELKEQSEQITKSKFREKLKKRIGKEINCDIDDLGYDKRGLVKKVLLMFNIQTILASEHADYRFPFNRYKQEDWDIEHVRSQTTKSILPKQRSAWAIDMLEFFTGQKGYSIKIIQGTDLSEKQRQHTTVTHLAEGEYKDRAGDLLKLLANDTIGDEEFEKVYKKMSQFFRESTQPEDIDGISNLALLDSSTNRSYQNAMFPIKGKMIKDNDMNGIFVPLCTKNLFLKSYSQKATDLIHWETSDAIDYLTSIKTVLKDYLPKAI